MRRARRVVAATTPPFVDGTPGPTPNPNVISGATDAARPTIPASGGGEASGLALKEINGLQFGATSTEALC